MPGLSSQPTFFGEDRGTSFSPLSYLPLDMKRGNLMALRLSSALIGVALICSTQRPVVAQDSGFNLGLHANSRTTAADIGLPVYPGAMTYEEKGSSAADLGLSFGDFHFALKAVDYKTGDSASKVLAYYRKPLSRYGEVLECDHGKPVGDLKRTNSGLTCSDEKGGHVQLSANVSSSDDHELRAGNPHKFRIVGISEAKDGGTRFGLVYLELPKDDDHKETD